MTLIRYFPVSRKGYANQSLEKSWTPAIDVIENADGYVLELDLPGFKKSDFTLTVKESILTISGERKRIEPEDEKSYRYHERQFGVFERSFKLPEYVDGEKIKASYKNGVLKLELSKKEDIKPRTIQIV